MNDRRSRLIQRISDELAEIERAADRAGEAWARAKTTGDDLYVDSVALNLHSFYDGIETLFNGIAGSIDGSIPEGHEWHKGLLRQMTMEVPGRRPAVISEVTLSALDEYRSLRHVVRHVYAHRIKPDKLGDLVAVLPPTLGSLRSELLAFASFLEQAPD